MYIMNGNSPIQMEVVVMDKKITKDLLLSTGIAIIKGLPVLMFLVLAFYIIGALVFGVMFGE